MATLVDHFATLARYNSIANLRLCQACSELPEDEYRKARPVSFGSIHGLLNHILLGDRIWMARFTSEEIVATPALNSELYADLPSLREARMAEDSRIEAFVARLDERFWSRSIRYVNSKGVLCEDPAVMLLGHLFNHQTHHRGQVHAMLTAAGVQPPSLDLHRAIRPDPRVDQARS